MKRFCLAAVIVVLFVSSAGAQGTNFLGRLLPTPVLKAEETSTAQPEVEREFEELPNPFGLGWGGGFAFSSNLVGVPLVEEGDAFIDENNRIRITHPRNVRSRVLMESHYTFKIAGPLALGPVIFVQPALKDVFDAAGGGILIELGEGPTSFNLMIGFLVDFDVSRLHRDYVDGFKSPTAELVFVRREEVQFLVGFTVGRNDFFGFF